MKNRKFFIFKILIKLKSILYPIKRIKALHEQIKSTVINKQTPYQLLLCWLLDTLQFGFICFLLYTGIFGWKSITRSIILIVGLGTIPTIIKFIKNAIIE